MAAAIHFSFAPAPTPPGLTYTVGNETGSAFYKVYIETWGSNGLIGPTTVFGNVPVGQTTYTIAAPPAAHIRGVRVYCNPWNQVCYVNQCGIVGNVPLNTQCAGLQGYQHGWDHQLPPATNQSGCMDGGIIRVGQQ